MQTTQRKNTESTPFVSDPSKADDRDVDKHRDTEHPGATPEHADQPMANSTLQRVALTVGVLFVSLAYAVVRYNVFGPVAVDQIPLYITNKAISIASLILIAIAFAARRIAPASRLGWVRLERRALGMIGLTLALVHTVISAILLNPTYFAKFFNEDNQLSAMAGFSLLAGAVALVLLLAQSRVKAGRDTDRSADTRAASSTHSANPRRTLRQLAIGVLLLTVAHVLFMGVTNWLTPGKWYGYLPPITLISFFVAIAALFVGMLPRK